MKRPVMLAAMTALIALGACGRNDPVRDDAAAIAPEDVAPPPPTNATNAASMEAPIPDLPVENVVAPEPAKAPTVSEIEQIQADADSAGMTARIDTPELPADDSATATANVADAQ